MPDTPRNGFTLVEMMIVLVVGGLLLAMAIPAVGRLSTSSDLKSASHNIGDQLMLAHEKAIASGQTQTIRFMANFQGASDYHIWNGAAATASWKLPKSVSYSWDTGTLDTYRMTSDGQCLDSGMIILKNARGDRDTISVRKSGLVLVY